MCSIDKDFFVFMCVFFFYISFVIAKISVVFSFIKNGSQDILHLYCVYYVCGGWIIGMIKAVEIYKMSSSLIRIHVLYAHNPEETLQSPSYFPLFQFPAPAF